MQEKPEQIAWAAGLFEGEGTWGYQPNKVSVALSMTDFEPVRRFHGIVGVGRLTSKPVQQHHSPVLMWRATSRADVEHVLELLRPWLGSRRIARGEEVLRLQANFTAASKQRQDEACENGHRRTPENTHLQTRRNGPPYRKCRECSREGSRRARRKRATA